ncbi:MAG: hypothetical protein AAF989_12635 [Planctomycetota bacterium]
MSRRGEENPDSIAFKLRIPSCHGLLDDDAGETKVAPMGSLVTMCVWGVMTGRSPVDMVVWVAGGTGPIAVGRWIP